MQISNLTNTASMAFSCNVYLIQGNGNTAQDVSTLIDVGNDPSVFDRISHMAAGIGKKRIEQVILTHSHFDHTAILELVRERFKPVVYARSTSLEADVLLEDGQVIICGDREMQVLCTPGHSEDSVCLYSPADGALFVGDTPVVVRSSDGNYEDRFVRSLERLCGKEVRTIYFGHGDPITKNAHQVLLGSLKNASRARTIPESQ